MWQRIGRIPLCTLGSELVATADLVEANEAPRAAAVREIEEELALCVAIGRLLVVDWVPPGLGPGDGVMFVYDGGVLDADQAAGITLPEAELRSWAWCDERAVAERLPGVLARRVDAAVRARRDGAAVYLEDGFPSV